MDGGGGVVPLENPLAAHGLPPGLGSVSVLGVFQRFAVLVLIALRRRKAQGVTGEHGERRDGLRKRRAALTCRPYLAFICFSSFCRRTSLSSLEGAGPEEDRGQSLAPSLKPSGRETGAASPVVLSSLLCLLRWAITWPGSQPSQVSVPEWMWKESTVSPIFTSSPCISACGSHLVLGCREGRSGGESRRVFPCARADRRTDGLNGDLQDPVSVDDCSVLAALVHQHVALLFLVKVDLGVELE